MNRTVVLIVVAAGVGLAIGLGMKGAKQGTTPAASKPAAELSASASASEASSQAAGISASSPAVDGKVIYTFTDDQQIRQFATLWQQRQGVILRASVLKSYWDEAQAGLTQLNQQISEKFGLDMTKAYSLNREQRALREAPLGSDGKPTEPSTEVAPSHTFASEEEMKSFEAMWQQQRGIVLRMATLQEYWKAEQSSLSQLNLKLASDYQVDPAKDYMLDGQRKVLIERSAPPTPAIEGAPAVEAAPVAPEAPAVEAPVAPPVQ